VEGRHFVAGPWFTVQESGRDWQELDRIWLSNGTEHTRVRVELKMRLED
jgi:hypothetical protein